MDTTTQQPPSAAQNSSNAVSKPSNNSLVDSALARINQLTETGALQLPKDYSAGNALRAAYLILQEVKDRSNNPVLQSCTKESIANALLKMTVQGLNPLKRQCSFIAYGNILVCQREYQGSIAVAKRYGLKSVIANAIYKGEEFSYEVDTETGRKKITKHVSGFENFGSEVVGAYAVIEMLDGTKNVEIMNMKQIQAAWNQGATKGQSPAHKNFPDQMACKTVINRAVKTIINSSDDGDLYEDDPITQTETPLTAGVKHEIATNANGAGTGEEIGFEEADMEQQQTTSQMAETADVKNDSAPVQQQEQTTESNQPINQPGAQIKAPF